MNYMRSTSVITRRFNNIMTGLILAGCAISSVHASPKEGTDPWETGYGLTNERIDNSKENFNTYEPQNSKLLPTSAYLSNWTHYSQGFLPSIDSLSKYDTLILSFFGLCGTEIGDPSIVSAIESLNSVCNNLPLPGGSGATFGESFKGEKFELRSTDPGADFMKEFPSAGIPSSNWNYQRLNENPSGLMGVMKKLHKEKGTKIAISIFGWSLSNIASQMVSTPESRKLFIDSVLQYLTAYPFIGQIDIDWEYPGIKGAENNVFDPENDAANYETLIREMRSAFETNGFADVKIAIASGAPQDTIDAAKLKKLTEAGVDTIHLMTYDFFGETWAENLAHHTNLMTNENSDWSADKSIRYMIDELDIDSKSIQIGYANYSRNALNANVETKSPLKGTFTKNNTSELVMGSFEGAVTAINDIFTHYLQADEKDGLTPINNYHLYTDEQANADYMLQPEKGIFISLDTPRTVYTKAQYATKNNLGGIFTWMADQDEGLMLNAAREGLGYKLVDRQIDMENIINSCGENVTPERCDELTHLSSGDVVVNAGADIETDFAMNTGYSLAGSVTNADEIKKTTWTLGTVSGIAAENVRIDNEGQLETSFSIVGLTEAPAKDVIVELSLNAELQDGGTVSDNVKYTLKKEASSSEPVINGITPSHYNMAIGGPLTLIADASDPEGSALTYDWTVTNTKYAIAFVNPNTNPTDIDLASLVNKPEYHFDVNLTVRNDDDNSDSETVTVTVTGDEDANIPPQASFVILSKEPSVGQAVLLQSTSTDELVDELRLAWTVSVNDQSVPVVSDGANYSFVPQEEGEYTIELKVTDVFSATDTAEQSTTVSDSGGIPAWDAATTYNVNCTLVTYEGNTYLNQWYVNPGFEPNEELAISSQEQGWANADQYWFFPSDPSVQWACPDEFSEYSGNN
ncbi:chitinase [Shewanella psychrophila]|uniref:chitinase n=1 Tax=Shewanella psychrophila TaxID=225848 RepID=A0A1S6HLY5_9GAMM|nr:glycosyl hydrolase family 18 protein [Shewanella psychrophila]AQS36522.1 chitinase [Shewanella psychrophila]